MTGRLGRVAKKGAAVQISTMFLKLYMKIENLTTSEEGQDLVEYALLVSLVALAAIASARSVASAITTVFSRVSTSIT